MKKTKICAYVILIIGCCSIPAFFIEQINNYMVLSEPYVLTTFLCTFIAAFIDSFVYEKSTRSNYLINTMKLMKWSGLTYTFIILSIIVLMTLFYLSFYTLDLITGKIPDSTNIGQGIGWPVIFFVIFPLILATPVILIFNLFIFMKDVLHLIFKHKITLEIEFIKKIENNDFLVKYTKLNRILDVLGIILFLLLSIFCLKQIPNWIPTSNIKFKEAAIRAEWVFSGVIKERENVDIDKLDVKQITELFANRLICTKIDSNKIKMKDGLIAEFLKQGKCSEGKCKIIVDLNGIKPPNKKWETADKSNDIVELTIIDNGTNVLLPNFIKNSN